MHISQKTRHYQGRIEFDNTPLGKCLLMHSLGLTDSECYISKGEYLLIHSIGISFADTLPRDMLADVLHRDSINRYVPQGIVFADTLPRDSIN